MVWATLGFRKEFKPLNMSQGKEFDQKKLQVGTRLNHRNHVFLNPTLSLLNKKSNIEILMPADIKLSCTLRLNTAKH